jgi:DNA polymerase alpha subunit A
VYVHQPLSCVFWLRFLRAAKKKVKDTSKAKAKPRAPPPPVIAPSISNYRPAVSEDQEQDLLDSILGGMDDILINTHKKSRKRKPSPKPDGHSSSPPRTRFSSYRSGKSASSGYEDTSSDGPINDGPAVPDSDDLLFSPKKVKTSGASGITPAIDKLGRMEVHSRADDSAFDNSFDDVDMDAFMDVDEEDLKPKMSKKEPTTIKSSLDKKPLKPTNGVPNKKDSDNPSWLSVYDSLSIAKDEPLGLNTPSSSSGNNSNISALEPDGSLRFFRFDYLEYEGKLYFIGKLKDKDSGAWVSCCVTVEGLQRNLFVLPREKRVEQDEEGTSYETDEVPGMKDVYDDFDRVRKKAGIKVWKAKFMKRKYAFGEADVLKESSWLKVVYGFDGTYFSFA